MKAKAKPGRPRRDEALEKVVPVRFLVSQMERIDAFRSGLPVESTQQAVIRHLVDRGLDAAEKEAARG